MAQDVGREIGAAAVRALYYELALYPKPGLVSLSDAGSHRDMDARTFMRSLFALRRYFCDIGRAGADGLPMDELRRIGLGAEQRMFINWRDRALAIHCEFVSRELSPGGAADLLAATLFVHELARP